MSFLLLCRLVKSVIVSFLIFVLASCVSYTGHRFVAPDPPNDDFATVYIYSAETGCFDLGQMNADIFVNGKSLFELAENSYVKLSLYPGYYSFQSSTDDQNACHGKWSPGLFWPPLERTIEPKESYFFQYNSASVSCVSTCQRHLVEVSEDIAIKEMQGGREIDFRNEPRSHINQ